MKELTQTNWHELPSNQVAATLESNPETGLAAGEIETRLRQFGPNQMTAQKQARTDVVNVIVMVQSFYLLNCRSRTRSMFSIGLFSNPWLLAGIAATWLAQLAFTYLPLLNRLFHTALVRAEAWLYIVAIGLFTFAAVELEKWLRFRKPKSEGTSP